MVKFPQARKQRLKRGRLSPRLIIRRRKPTPTRTSRRARIHGRV